MRCQANRNIFMVFSQAKHGGSRMKGPGMFQVRPRQSTLRSGLAIAELVYHSAVRDVRRSHSNALLGLLMNMLQTVIFIITFYALFWIMGTRGSAIRGDYLLYIMSGIFLFMTHTKAVAAISGAEGPASPMMQHAPMTTFIAISAAALSSLYLQVLSLLSVLFIYHVVFTPVVIDDPIGAMGMVLAAWISGVGVGVIFYALKPWWPGFVQVGSNLYSRINMIASGKMFVANTLPGYLLAWFDWNPLFHTIDQARGYIFIHYNPHFSSPTYPLYVALGLIVIGLMGEFYTRKYASISWSAAR